MLEDGVEMHTSFRWLLSASIIFERTVEDISQETRFDFYSREQILSRADQIDEQIESAINRLLTQIQEMSERESNFCFQKSLLDDRPAREVQPYRGKQLHSYT